MTPLKVLIIDDEQERHDRFAKIYHDFTAFKAYDFQSACEILDEHSPFDVVQIDYDLHLGDKGGYTSVKYNGFDIACYITRIEDDKKPRRIVIHSWNPDGARKIYDRLIEVGIPTTYRPHKWRKDKSLARHFIKMAFPDGVPPGIEL